MRERSTRRTVALVALVIGLGLGQAALDRSVAAREQGARQAPRFEVDPFWPKPLPNHWLLGNAIGVWADAQDRVWIIHRGSATLADNEKALELKAGDCCAGAPPVLAFDRQGNLVHSWGGPGNGYDWPASNHGIFVDATGAVWIGGNGAADSHIVKFTQDGKFLAQYGKPGARRGAPDAKGQATFTGGSQDKANFGRVAKIFVDPKANEAFIADGYLNKRVAVIDAKTGAISGSGAPTASRPTIAISAATIPTRRRRRSSGTPCTAPTSRTTVWSTSAIA